MDFTVNKVTEMAAGSQQTMTFKGSAVHGGGSCQISLVPGLTPTADSQFKVIHSIQGGCPGLDGGTTPASFKIPSDIASGEYTLAWTWFNRIGNREMYMNCAPIKVTGGSGNGLAALPDMAVFNIQSKNSCKTVEGADVQFPDPGASLENKSTKLAPPTGCGGASAPAPAAPASGNTGSTGGNTGGSGTSGTNGGTGTSSANNGLYTGIGAGAGANKPASAASAPAASAPAASAPAASSPASSKPTGAFAEGASAPAASQATASAAAPAASSAAAAPAAGSASQAAPAPAASSASSTGGSTGASGTCSPDGSVVCSDDGMSFGICNWGKVAFSSVATGTKCSGGQILKRQVFNA